MNRYLQWMTCIILLACVAMVSAENFDNIDKNIIINQIQQNHTIFFGEEHLNVTDCLKGKTYMASHIVTIDRVMNVTDSLTILDPTDFSMPTDKEENTWYQASNTNVPILDDDGNPIPAFVTQEPILSFNIWNLNTDMKAAASVQRGTLLQYKFTTSTNLDDIASRLDYYKTIYQDPKYGSYINFGIVAPDGEQYLQLMTLGRETGTTKLWSTAGLGSSLDIPEGKAPGYVWPGNLNADTPDPTGWMTDWRDAGTGQETDYHYQIGSYDVTAICNVNNMFKNRPMKGHTWDSNQVSLTPRNVTVSVTPPSGKNREASFTATITGMTNTSYEIFIFDQCPPKMTGKICERPPYISGDRMELLKTDIALDPIDGPYLIGTKRVVDCCTEGMTIRQAVPSGDAYPSQGDWDIFEDGTRYYAKVTTGPDGKATVPFYIDTTVMPGTFTIQVQDTPYNLKSTATVTVSLGAITGAVKDPAGKEKSGNIFYLGDEIWIDGTNSDSALTYIWLTGPGLDPCGVNLFNPLESNDPVKAVVYDTKNGISNYWRVEPNWDTVSVPIGSGQYTIWMASVDPDCRYCQCDASGTGTCGFGDCFGVDCEEGVCSLKNCPQCAAVTSIDITLIAPDLTAKVNDTVRFCCPGPTCGQLGGVQEIWLTGESGGNACKQLQVWLFGQSQFGLKNYLMTVTPLYCDGTYAFELNKGLLQANGIDLCSIATGKYDIIVQAPGANNIFDIRLGEQQPNGERYVLTTIPTNDSKLFLIEGKNSLIGGAAEKALIDGFNPPAIDDLYAYVSFELTEGGPQADVDFTANPVTGFAPLNVSFISTATMNVTSWAWIFDDGTTSSEQNPSHTYLTPGSYSVKVSASDGTTSKEKLKTGFITVIQSPEVGFEVNPSSGYTGTEFQFTDLTTGSPSSWLWDFEDGSTSNLQSPTHVFTSPGSYPVNLTVSNAYGQVNSFYLTVLVMHDQPVAAFSASRTETKTYPAQINFLDQSTGGGLTSWLWDFGDNSTSTNENPSHLYVQPGNYTVSLTVSNDGGTDTEIKQNFITIGPVYSPDPNPKPVSFSAIPTLGNTPLLVNFTDTSEMAGVNWSWDFGDGGVSDEQDPGYVYETKGTYSVSLVVDDGTSTNTTTMKDYISVVDVPIVDFSFKPVTDYSDKDIQFTDQSTGNPTSWMWDFDDGSTSSLQSPVHSFAEAGTYSVTLTVSNAYGIGTPVTKDIVIMNDGPVAAFTANPQNSTSYPAEVYFTDQSIGDEITSWFWDFGDGATSTTKSPIHMYLLPGLFNVTLTVSNNGGEDTLEKVNYITIGSSPGDIYTLTIYPEWNHFSIPAPLVEEKNTVAEVFEGIDRGVEPAYIFSAETQDYEAIADDTVLEPLTMYKIWYDREDQNQVTFSYENWNSTFSKDLTVGWNGIGLTGPVPVPASEALKSLGESWDKLIWYDGDKQDWMGPVVRGETDYTLLYPVKGYMVDMNADATLEG